MQAQATHKLYLPLEQISLTAVVGPSTSLAPLEQLVLRAVHAGANTVANLDTIFGLGHRPMLRLVLQLINVGYLSIDYDSGYLSPSSRVKVAIEENEGLSSFENTNTYRIPISLTRDLVAGSVLPLLGHARGVRSGYQLEPCIRRGDYQTLDQEQLLKAAGEIIRKKKPRKHLEEHGEREQGRMKLLALGLDVKETPGAEGHGQVRIAELEVRVSIDEATDYMRVEINRPDNLNGLVQRQLEKKLTELANADEPPLALKNLRQKPDAAHVAEAALDVAGHIAQLQSQVARLLEANKGTYPDWQSKLAQHARTTRVLLAEQVEASVQQRTVHAQDEQLRLIQDMIGRSERQVVLVCPRLRYNAMSHLREAIIEAMERGVQFFLLWGLRVGGQWEELGDVRNWFFDLKEEFPAQFFFASDPANLRANLAIADAAEMIATSYEFLAREPSGSLEIGMWVGTPNSAAIEFQSGPDAGGATERAAVCIPALQALRIVKEIYPDYSDRQEMLTVASDFGAQRASTFDALASCPTRKQAPDDEQQQEFDRMWLKRWSDYVPYLEAKLGSLDPTAEIIRDAQHQQLLYHSLRTARYRIVVRSMRSSGRVIDRRFIELLEACLSREVHVLLVCPGLTGEVLRQLRELESSEAGARLRVLVPPAHNGQPVSNARFMIVDNTALVSSFDLLSDSREMVGAARHRMPTEIGMLTKGGEAADKLLEVYGQREPEILAAMRAAPAAERPAPPAARVATPASSRETETLIQRIRDVEAKGSAEAAGQPFLPVRAMHLTTWFETAKSADEALYHLDNLREAQVVFLPQAIASCLEHWADRLPVEALDRWLVELIKFLWWERRDAVGTLVLTDARPFTESIPEIPPQHVAWLAAFQGSLGQLPADYEDRIIEIVETDDRSAMQAATAVLVPLAVFSDAYPAAALGLLADGLSGGLAAWARAAIHFRTFHPRAQSRERLLVLSDASAMLKRRGELQKALLEQIEKTRSLDFTSKLFRPTWASLRGGMMGFDRLYEAVKDKDVEYVERYLEYCAEHYGQKQTATKMLDRTSAEVGTELPGRRQRIQDTPRQRSLERINDLLKLAKKWVAVARAVEAEVETLEHPALRDLVATLATYKPSVEVLYRAAVKEHRYEAPLLEDMISYLEPVWKLEDMLP